MKIFNKKAGVSILGLLILAGIVILVLKYMQVDIQVVAENSTGQENINNFGDVVKNFWDTYIVRFWDDIWTPLFWKPFMEGMKNSNSLLNNFNNSLPQVDFGQ